MAEKTIYDLDSVVNLTDNDLLIIGQPDQEKKITLDKFNEYINPAPFTDFIEENLNITTAQSVDFDAQNLEGKIITFNINSTLFDYNLNFINLEDKKIYNFILKANVLGTGTAVPTLIKLRSEGSGFYTIQVPQGSGAHSVIIFNGKYVWAENVKEFIKL